MIVFRGGRVIDPGTGSDGIADVLIDQHSVIAVGVDLTVPPECAEVDIAGMVIGPGFVDLHSHTHTIAGHRLQAMDGVTTALDLEAGLMPLSRAYAEAESQGRPLNFGFSASWGQARAQAHLGIEPDASIASGLAILGEPDWQRTSTLAERSLWLDLLASEIADGALGIGVLMGYAPRTDPAEFLDVARLAEKAGVPVYSHVRELVESDPSTPIDGSEELVIAAAETGASMHHCHVNSTSRRHVDRVLRLIQNSQAQGSNVTVEAYPYGAGSTAIGAFFLAPERLGAWGMRPSNITVVATGEQVSDASRLRELRATDPGAACIIAYLDEADPGDLQLLQQTLAFPDAIVASDAMPIIWNGRPQESVQWPLPPGGTTHPRTAGTFARTLRWLVRETGTWSWVEAFRRCSYLPARVLDQVAPGAKRKGILSPGADADLVILDPDRITDAATYLDGARPSIGIRHLLVAGEFVVHDDQIVTTALPGRALRGAGFN